ncbi:MAG TPA: energy transducer TonB [Terriglobales bacterium]|nr:energy transducer TonB [Terriglobales bacterium]
MTVAHTTAGSGLDRIVFGSAEAASERLPLWVLMVAIAMHLAAGGAAWWGATAEHDTAAPPPPRILEFETIEIEPPKLKPEPVVVPPPPPPAPVAPKVIEPVKAAPKAPPPKPLVAKPTIKEPKKVNRAEAAQAAQVVAQEPQAPAPAAAANSYDIVTGSGEQYAGGMTAPSGKSKKAVADLWASYEKTLLAWIERHKRYPRNALRRRLEGRPTMEIRIDRSGQLVSSKLVESSHHSALDEAALAMIQRAAPFPRLPAEHRGETYVFRFGVDFNIGRN